MLMYILSGQIWFFFFFNFLIFEALVCDLLISDIVSGELSCGREYAAILLAFLLFHWVGNGCYVAILEHPDPFFKSNKSFVW
jgi:hypothetical protein